MVKIGSVGLIVQLVQRIVGASPDGVFGWLTRAAVVVWQVAHGLIGDGVVGSRTMSAMGGEDSLISRSGLVVKSTRKITEIIIHCSATPPAMDIGVKEIDRWHRQRGFGCIGYNYVVRLNGVIECGRDVDMVGAHCLNHNARSIGVCYVGGVAADCKTPLDTRTSQQRDALLMLLRELRRIYPHAVIRGHRDFANKACPSFDATSEYSSI